MGVPGHYGAGGGRLGRGGVGEALAQCAAGRRVCLGVEHQGAFHAPSAREVANVQAAQTAVAARMGAQLAQKLREVGNLLYHEFKYLLAVQRQARVDAVAVFHRGSFIHNFVLLIMFTVQS